jgi:myo-inositol 2-dehydrogenase/D-chiro-inositol 1-dehydrogenase
MSNEPVRVGLLGAGFITDYHLTGLQQAGADVVSIFSQTEANAQAKAERFGIPHYTSDYPTLLARDDVEAVVITTPDYTHEHLAIASAKAGKAIYLQKPMARNSRECLNIINAAQAAGVPLFVSFMHRYMVEVEKMQQLLAAEALGTVYEVRQRNATAGADWAGWFYSKEKVGGGVVLQLGVHGIDLLRFLFGEITRVKATTVLMKKERRLADGSVVRPDNEDTALAAYHFGSGAVATHEMTFNELAGTDRFRMEIYGEKGTAWLRSERGRLALYAPDFLGQDGWFEPTLSAPDFGRRQHHHFLSMLRGEEPGDTSAQDGLATLLVSEAIYRSAESGIWEEVRRS